MMFWYLKKPFQLGRDYASEGYPILKNIELSFWSAKWAGMMEPYLLHPACTPQEAIIPQPGTR